MTQDSHDRWRSGATPAPPAVQAGVGDQLGAERPLPGRVVALTGPTACGKSTLALTLAARFGGTVINADSMQVYRGLRLLTDRPGPAAMARVPHRLYGVLRPDDPCSAARWRSLADAEIDTALAAGRLPILVGGTGLYLRALLRGLAGVPAIPPAIRAAVRRRQARVSPPVLHAELAEADPAMAARLDPHDSQRVARALEVVRATGRSLAAFQAGEAGALAPTRHTVLLVAARPPRAPLYRRIEARLATMLEAGALGEVAALRDLGLDPALPALRAVGVPELSTHLAGRCGRAEALAAAQAATRRYAKRQLTWLRHQTPRDAPRAFFVDAQFSESVEPRIFNEIREFVLTAQP